MKVCEHITLAILYCLMLFLQLHASPMTAIPVPVQTVLLNLVIATLTAMSMETAVLMWLM